ncbi:57a2640c-1249-43d6-a55e-6bede3abbe9e [Sclerotinia trifoliorum]|uniref:57a2640c-1249-43d6-a55e-6bede3abbe9e n=1 Tax=Sclerotinia trifoliorum TaxID=28548 RepID=A0A8H2VQQ0_9HELO|nr:57a2640c-1249-43d6-a55e-6bede3abbe9e [Sclerotinia trifoliorum]
MEMPFTEQEQRFLLAEVIKTSSIPPEKLLVILNESNVNPNWLLMQVPQGRNLASCINTFESLAGRNSNNLTPQLPPPQFFSGGSPGLQNKRKSVSDLELTGVDSSRKRRTPGLDVVSAQRNIQPKPVANGSPISFASPFVGQGPKKRGRPSKKDLKLRQAEEIARGEILGSLETPKSSINSPIVSGGDISLENILSAAPVTLAQESEPSSIISFGDQTDSGRKKRGRPTSRSSNVPRTGEGSFPILAAQFSRQVQPLQRFGTQQTFDRAMRAQFQPGSREGQIHRGNQAQGMQFDVQGNTEKRQMYIRGDARDKEQQEMQYKGAAMERKSMDQKDDKRSEL